MRLPLHIALASAASSVLYSTAVLFPPVATPLLVVVPLPALLLATTAPPLSGSAWLATTTATLCVLLGGVPSLAFALILGLPALALTTGLKRRWSIERTVLAGVAAWCAGVLALALLTYGDVSTVLASAREQLSHGVDLALSTYGSLGGRDGMLTAVEAERQKLISGLIDILPAVVVLTGGLVALTNVVCVRSWGTYAPGVNLRLWRTPEGLIWLLIASGFGAFVPLHAVSQLAGNLFLIVLGCYFCQGLAIVSYYLERFHLPRGVRVAGYALIAVQHIVAAIVLALGVFDLWGNFRRLSAEGVELPTDSE